MKLPIWYLIIILLTTTALIIMTDVATAATINVPADQPTIQAAIDVATDGDIIIVADGTYSGNINFNGKNVTVSSANGPAACTISGGTSCVNFQTGETENAVLDGFTITGAAVSSNGHGIYINGASPTISNCIIRNNDGVSMGSNYGSGIYLSNSSAKIINCVIKDNRTGAGSLGSAYGSGVYISGGNAEMINCIVANNYLHNQGGGNGAIYITGAAVELRNCTVTNNNKANASTGGVYCTGGSTVNIYNSILWANSGYDARGSSSTVTLYTCDVGSSTGVTQNACVAVSPLFVDAGTLGLTGYGDYHLQDTSPCIDAGDNSHVSGIPTDLDGNPRVSNLIVDMGAYELPQDTIYVHGTTGLDTNDGLSWATAVKTIQKGIDRAIEEGGNGWTVIVADGTYTGAGNGNLDFKGYKLTVTSVGGAGACIIDCENVVGTRGFHFHSGETNESILEGFTIQNGNLSEADGAGIFCENSSSPTIRNCIIKDCYITRTGTMSHPNGGGGVNFDNSSPRMINCIIRDNEVNASGFHVGGGGIWLYKSSAEIVNCVIANNDGGSGMARAAVGSEGSGSSFNLINCTIVNNSGGGIFVPHTAPGVKNCIIWNNGTAVSAQDQTVTLNSCDYNGGFGGPVTPDGNCISVDPLFVDAGSAGVGGGGDYHLQGVASPCIDVGDNSYITGVDKDLDGNARISNSTVDMGAYELVQTPAAPTVSVTNPASPATSPVTINYTVSDPNGDNTTVTFDYSTDGGGTWNNATAAAGDSNPQTSVPPGSHTFLWNVAADLPGQTIDVKVRVTVEDPSALTGEDITDTFTIDTGAPLDAPTNFTGVGVATNQIDWTWNDAAGATGYRLEDAGGSPLRLIEPGWQQYVETVVSGENALTTRLLRSCTTSLAEVSVEPAGTVGGAALPWNLAGYHAQYLYTAAELSGTAGLVRKIYWQRLNSGAGADYAGVFVRVGHSTRTDLNSIYASNYDVDGSELVRDPALYSVPATSAGYEWLEIPLDSVFYYNGSDNFVLEINVTSGAAAILWSKVDLTGEYPCVYGDSGVTSGMPWERKFFLKLEIEVVSSAGNAATATAYTLVHDAVTDDFSLTLSGTDVVVTVVEPPNAYAGLTGVKIERATNDTFTQDATTIQDFTGNYTFTDTDVSAGATYWYRVTYSNGDGIASTESAGESITVIGPDTPPVADITAPTGGTHSDNVQIAYDLTDYDGDPAGIVAEYSTDGGGTWDTATMGSGGDGTSPLASSLSGTSHLYVWDTVTDGLGASGPEAVQLRITPSDNDGTGTADTTSFTVNNTTQQPPTVAITDPTTGTHSGDITITYTLTDANGDNCDLIVEYSTDAGGSWNPCTPGAGGDGTTGLGASASGTTHTFVWVSGIDLPGFSGSVTVRIIADDGNAGTGGGADSDTTTFLLDNTGIVTAHFTGSPVTGDAPLTVQFTDLSAGDITSWLWDFGDGATSAQQSPSHVYTAAGDYTVSLTVSGPSSSDVETRSGYVSVTAATPPPVPPAKKDKGCSCTLDRSPTPRSDLLGYFLPALLIACAYLTLRRRFTAG